MKVGDGWKIGWAGRVFIFRAQGISTEVRIDGSGPGTARVLRKLLPMWMDQVAGRTDPQQGNADLISAIRVELDSLPEVSELPSAPAASDPQGRQPKSVLRDWVSTLPLQQQGVLVAAVRGPDGVTRECAAKELVRAYRATILHNALSPETSKFQGNGSGIPVGVSRWPRTESIFLEWSGIDPFFKEVDALPLHWFLHLVHAAEIVGYEHPTEEVASFWGYFYLRACDAMHVNPETRDQMRARLSADGSEVWKF